MFSTGDIYITIFAILLSLAFIGVSVGYVTKMSFKNTQEYLVKYVVVVFTVLLCVFVIDKVLAFKIDILTEKQSDELFELIKCLTIMIFSYYFGTQTQKKPEKIDEDEEV